MTGEGPIRDRWRTREEAQREIDRFRRRFGPKALYLAGHAALPLILSPELLHLIRVNFVEELGIPPIAEADLLLSPLCRPLDEPLYEMEPRVREILLEHLPLDFGPDRPLRTAQFLLRWLEKTPESNRAPEETDAHTWVFNAWLQPEETVDRLAKNFTAEFGEGRRSASLKLAILTEALAAPFSEDERTETKYRGLVDDVRRKLDEEGRAAAASDGETGSSPQPGDVLEIRVGKAEVPMRFVYIPPGEFWMGSPEDEPERFDDESPRHKVSLDYGFFMQETPVTQGQWAAAMGGNPSRFTDGGPECPVENVFWDDAKKFIGKLNPSGGEYSFRFPSEAEWEYACRAGTGTPFWTGKCLGTDQANYDGNYPLKGCPKGKFREKTTPVKTFAPNPWGLYDMHGNVWEWCEDDWHDNYKNAPADGSAWVDDPRGAHRVIRGGSWDSDARVCRSACRSIRTPAERNDLQGFRVLAVRRTSSGTGD